MKEKITCWLFFDLIYYICPFADAPCLVLVTSFRFTARLMVRYAETEHCTIVEAVKM